ncbi:MULTISPECIES: nicotianamine synthase family protein [unclassified Lysinibacillus]|uniref:nicotianamine synthase family protein n=1 Tax=unclassified Lysinibacillus TaxID=2636778 RepID=UPI0009C8C784|nr:MULTISPECIES: nicotianamine synthase family protein [unclassified Lysinibacillus]SKB64779.1 Nicotianamine synthase protein [Lysinibacillus sp. AC-3]
MKDSETLLMKLHYFASMLEFLIDKHNQDQMVGYYSELEEVIDDYSSFITNSENENQWHNLKQTYEISLLIEKLRKMSADCVKIMEKHWALKYLHETEEMTDYFRNIEGCIEKEHSGFPITNKSKVLVVGSGPFPITLLSIATRTGADVLGIDIDDEAILLGRQVATKLGNHTIQIENKSVDELQSIQQISHIIFSSTVNCKYDILEQLHDLTNKDVMIAMRYGNGLKSLFNYPMETVDATKWRIVEKIAVSQGVFDIALYQKV